MKKILLRSLLLLSFSFLFQGAYAQSLDEAITLYGNGKYNDSAEVLRKLNPQTPKAKAFLCQLYADKLISANDEESSRVCQEAVVAKDPIAIYIYALAYLNGNDNIKVQANPVKGIGFMSVDVIDSDFAPAYDFFCVKLTKEQNYSDAINFCKVAASKGMRRSLYIMGTLTAQGKGVIQDFKKSKNFMLASAALNNPAAYIYLGEMARDGKYGDPKDAKQAYAWFSLAAAADTNNNMAAQSRDALQLNSQDMIAAQQLASSWKSRTPKLIDYHKGN
jgi:TPR repeat protein